MSDDFEIIITQDGSPTLCQGAGEPMHNVIGAISETYFCYTQPLQAMASALGEAPSLMVVGLGLGAIEMLAITGPNPPSQVASYESEAALRDAMDTWLAGGDQHSLLVEAIERQAQSAAKVLGKPLESIRKELRDYAQSGRWQIKPALTEEALPEERFNVIAFDAYSQNTSPALWSDDFLCGLLAKASEERAMLSTYAAKGALKRALKNAGFEMLKRRGFGHKRESTLAIRSVDPSFFEHLLKA